MIPSRSPASPADALEHLIESFEKAWQGGSPPRLEEYLGNDPACRRELLEELVRIDLEFRWRFKPAGCNAWVLEDYLRHFPDLGPAEQLSGDLIGWEYWIRQRWGDQPAAAEYLQRFARTGAGLQQVLSRIDADLKAEFANQQFMPAQGQSASTAVSTATPQPVISLSVFLETLQRLRLLTPSRLEELQRPPLSQAGNARGLARELLQRGWLTAYQINQLLQGRGQDLTLGPYLLLERLGEGGAGQVFKARHQGMRRTVAIKVIHKELMTDPEIVSRFWREIRLVSQLQHPNIVCAYDAGPADSMQFLVMEFAEGIDLDRMVQQSGPLPVAQACEYIRQAALGLQHIAEHGLVHRDIKPSNLLLAGNLSTIKILDLGLARLRPREGQPGQPLDNITVPLTQAGAYTMGTPDYMAPEQALDFHGADMRTDIYSLGCTIYYLLTGQAPFHGLSLAQKLLHHQQAEPPPVEELRPETPRLVAQVVHKMMAKRPEDRYQTPAAVAGDLQAILASDDILLACQATLPRRLWRGASPLARRGYRRVRRWPWPAQAATAGGLALGVMLLFFWLYHTVQGWMPYAALSRLDASRIPRDARPDWLPRDVVAVLATGQSAPLRFVAFAPDGDSLAAGAGDATVRFWDLVTLKERGSVHAPAAVRNAAFSPSGQLFAVPGGKGRTVELYQLPEARKLKPITLSESDVVQVKYSPAAGVIAALAPNGTVWLLDESTGRPLGPSFNPTGGHFPAVAFSLDGKTLATYTPDSKIRMWDVATSSLRQTLTSGQAPILAFRPPDGKLMALAGTTHPIRLWDPATGIDYKTFPGHKGQVTGLSFQPQGKYLVSSGDDGRVVLWDIERGISPMTWEFPGPVHDVAFAPDGRHLATANSNGNVYILRLPSNAK